MADGTKVWISYQSLAFLSIFSCWQLIQNSSSSCGTNDVTSELSPKGASTNPWIFTTRMFVLFYYRDIYILQKLCQFQNSKWKHFAKAEYWHLFYRYDITMYDFIHIIQFLIPIWSWISKMMLENETFEAFLLKCCFLSEFWKTYFLSGKVFPIIGKVCSLATTLPRFRKN